MRVVARIQGKEGKETRLQSAWETVTLLAKGEWVFLRAPLPSNRSSEKMANHISFARANSSARAITVISFLASFYSLRDGRLV